MNKQAPVWHLGVNLYSTLLIAALLLPTVAIALDDDENSIPDPTSSTAMALEAEGSISVVGNAVAVTSDTSTVQIVAVEFAPADHQPLLAVRILLGSSNLGEMLYLDLDQVAQLRDEMASLQAWYESASDCEASKMCVEGVARCRATQEVPQAICPGIYYSVPEQEQGVLLATPRNQFRFPATEPSGFVMAFDKVVDDLK